MKLSFDDGAIEWPGLSLAACAVITSTFAAIASYQCPEGNCTDRAPVASTFTAAKATAKKLLTSQLQIAQMVRDEAVVQGGDPDAWQR